MDLFETSRRRMVVEQLIGRGIDDKAILKAMGEVPREYFVSAGLVEWAYEDSPLSIEEGQTISQPYIVAYMLQLLHLGPSFKLLEVGAGSGYAAAVASQLVKEVFAIEIYPSLVEKAESRFRLLGYRNIKIKVGDGSLGWGEEAPYDAILVSAGGPSLPESLLTQLKVGGRLIMPVGIDLHHQELTLVEKQTDNNFKYENCGSVSFVPLKGAEGWK